MYTGLEVPLFSSQPFVIFPPLENFEFPVLHEGVF
jgi:hypothetical protein